MVYTKALAIKSFEIRSHTGAHAHELRPAEGPCGRDPGSGQAESLTRIFGFSNNLGIILVFLPISPEETFSKINIKIREANHNPI